MPAKNGPILIAAPPTPWYKNSCITGALGTAALKVGIDAIGLIPEAEGFTKVFENTAGYQMETRGRLPRSRHYFPKRKAGLLRPLTLTGSLNSTTTKYVQQVNYFPQGSVYYWQYGNNVWPVETYTKNLQPYTNYATVGNSASSYLMFLQDNWTTNGLVGSGQECYGAAVTGANMTWVIRDMRLKHN